jgi:hypothetical protein
MKPRFSDRIAWRLTAHFFRALFDFGILSTAGADSFKQMLLGTIGVLVATGLLLTRIYAGKYAALRAMHSPELFRRAALGDDLLIIGLPTLFVAFITLLVSQSLFPDERDFRVLGPLPVRRTLVFGTKLAALLLYTGMFVTVAHLSLIPLVLLTTWPFSARATLSRMTVWAIASVSASAFAVLAITAVVGVFVVVLSRTRLHAMTATIRSMAFAGLVLCVPLVLRLPRLGSLLVSGSPWLTLVPPAWFVGVEQVLQGSTDPLFFKLSGIAVTAVGVAAVIVAIAYIVLFRRFEGLMLHSAMIVPHGSAIDRPAAFMRATPAFRGVHRFITLTLRRSQLPQSVLVSLSACGVAVAMNGLIEANLAGWLGAGGSPPSSLVRAAMWTPFALMFVCGLSMRAALALPVTRQANWIFRTTEDRATRADQLRAVDHVVMTYVVGVPVVTAVPMLWLTVAAAAVIAEIVVALVGLVFVHAVLLDWRRIPFTCSYLPGKRFVGHSLVVGVGAYLLFTLVGVGLVRMAIADARHAVVIVAVLSIVAITLRRRRLAMWRQVPLMFEDEFPNEPLQLRL